MDEKVVVKLIKNGKVLITTEFRDYDQALKYARDKVENEGYRAILLRLLDRKPWAKVTLFPRETC